MNTLFMQPGSTEHGPLNVACHKCCYLFKLTSDRDHVRVFYMHEPSGYLFEISTLRGDQAARADSQTQKVIKPVYKAKYTK